MSVILDGKVISSPTIVAPIDGGHAAFTGNFSQAQAEEIVKRIKTAIPTE
jgi:preprotein translocase subunit SecD